MKRLFIVAAPIDSDIERRDLSNIVFGVDTTDKVESMLAEHSELKVWDIEDFVEKGNDQEIDLEGIWMESINIEVPDNYTPNTSEWYWSL